MKTKTILAAAMLLLSGLSAHATYQRLASCSGVTDKRDQATVTLYANIKNDTQGLVVVNIDGVNDYASNTKIDWNSTAEGYPRFYDNDFDLDLVVDMIDSTVDDILVENDYIQKLECKYTPKK